MYAEKRRRMLDILQGRKEVTGIEGCLRGGGRTPMKLQGAPYEGRSPVSQDEHRRSHHEVKWVTGKEFRAQRRRKTCVVAGKNG